MSDTGYECPLCGYQPTESELQNGLCPRCNRWRKPQETGCREDQPLGGTLVEDQRGRRRKT